MLVAEGVEDDIAEVHKDPVAHGHTFDADGAVLERPELVDDICFKPGICPNWRSSGAVTDDVMTSGLAPG